MTGLAILDVAIGLVFVYLLLSMLCTIINEMISRVLSMRSKTLRKGIGDLLADPNWTELADEVCKHPLIQNCGAAHKKKKDADGKPKRKFPSYIPSATFAQVLIDVIDPDAKTKGDAKKAIASLKAKLDQKSTETGKKYKDTEIGKALNTLLGHAETTLDEATKNIEQWFDGGMDRVSGWYKRWKQGVSLGVALVIAVALNANSFVIADALYKDAALRDQFVKRAEAIITDCKDSNGKKMDCRKNAAEIKKQLRSLPLGWEAPAKWTAPLKWKMFRANVLTWFSIFGLLLTALAISMGAPFWFDVLNKLNSIRMTGIKPKTSAEKAAGSAA